MKTLSNEQMEKTEGGKFWGATYTWENGVCTRTYQVIWIKIKEESNLLDKEYCNAYYMGYE